MKSDPFLDACRAEMPEKVKAIVDRRFLIADQIYSLMVKHEITTLQLAQKMETKEYRVNRWISGMHSVSVNTIARLESIFGERITANHSSGRAL